MGTVIDDLGASICIKFSFDPEFVRFYNSYLQDEVGQKKLRLLGLHPDQMNVPYMSYRYFKEGTRAISVDVNANIGETRAPNNYWAEVTKGVTKINCFYLVWRYAAKLYGKEEASRLCSYILDGKLYFHDLSGPTKLGVPYCFAWSTYNLIVDGRPWGSLESFPPHRYDSFIKCVTETLLEMSQEFAGALAVPSLCVDFTWYLLKHFTKEEIFDSDNTKVAVIGKGGVRELWSLTKVIENQFQHFVHVVNSKFRTGHECVDEETEVLTPDGFKTIDDLKVGDDIYVWKDGKLSVEKVKRVNIYDYDGEMHVYEGRNYTQQVTPNHNVLRCRYNADGYVLQPSSELIDFKSPIQFPVACYSVEDDGGIDLRDEEIELLAFLLTEGAIEEHKVRILKSPNRWGVERLEEILEALSIKYTKSLRNSYVSCCREYGKYSVFIYTLRMKDARKYVEMLNGTKNDIPSFLLKMNTRQSRRFLETWAKLDGYSTVGLHRADSSFKMRLQCDNYIIADKLQHIAVRAGYSSRITSRLRKGNQKETIYLYVYKNRHKTASKKKKVHYKGRVWCPTTDAGIVVYRKNGQIFISGNSPFINVTAYDRKTFESVYGNLVYPDGTRATDIFDCVDKVQRIWMEFFARKDPKSGRPYRFPVFTISLFINEDGSFYDNEFADFVAKINTEGVFNLYLTHDTAKVCSCCRLFSDLMEASRQINIDSFGNGGSSIGSQRIVTINLARACFDAHGDLRRLKKVLDDRLDAARKLLMAHRYLIKKRIEKGMLKFFTIGWIDLDRMFFNTIGIIGLNECVDFIGYDITSDEGMEVAGDILKYIKDASLRFVEEEKCMFNVEQIPGESAAITLAELDRLRYDHPYRMYANQFVPLWVNVDLATRAYIDGKLLKYMSGGGISHLNISEKLEPRHVKALMEMAARCGLEHFAINPKFSVCENGHAFISNSDICPVCGGKVVDYVTRVVGYFVSVKNDFNYVRRDWEFPKREFFKKEDFEEL